MKIPTECRQPNQGCYVHTQEQINNHAQMPSMVHTSNTSTYSQDKRILSRDISRLTASNQKHLQEEHPTSVSNEPNMISRLGYSYGCGYGCGWGGGYSYGYGCGHSCGYGCGSDQTMWEKKRRRTNTAPPRKNCTTSDKKEHGKDHEQNPMAEDIPDSPSNSD